MILMTLVIRGHFHLGCELVPFVLFVACVELGLLVLSFCDWPFALFAPLRSVVRSIFSLAIGRSFHFLPCDLPFSLLPQ